MGNIFKIGKAMKNFRLVVTKTPLRLTFTGGGTDLAEYYNLKGHTGKTISTTINKYIYVTVATHFYKDEIKISYAKSEIGIKRIDDIQHPTVREALRYLNIKSGIQITSITEIPSHGTGLGSSSSFLVGLLNALHAWKGEIASPEQLAEEACYIERDVLKEAGGKQDQYAAAYGGVNLMEFRKNGIKVTPIKMDDDAKDKLQDNLMLFYIGERSSTKIHENQIAHIKENLKYYDKMKALTSEVYNELSNNRIDHIGNLLDTNWQYKKELSSKISNDKIDQLYKKAIYAGAEGGKLIGAGSSGFLMFYVPQDKQEEVKKMLWNLKYEPFKFESFGSRVIHMEGE